MTGVAARIKQLTASQRAEIRERLWERGLPATALDGHLDPDATYQAPASFTQRRMAFLHQLDPHSAAGNSGATCRLEGVLRPAALEEALNAVLRRHAALRTVLPIVEGTVVQQVVPPRHRRLPVIDLTHLPAREREHECRRLSEADAARPFDLAEGPLTRFHLVRLSAAESVLLLDFHHAVVDGWSLGVFAREVAECYRAAITGTPACLPELPLQYPEYARWQQDWSDSAEARRQIGFWERELEGAPEVLALPADRPRPRIACHAGALYRFTLPPRTRDAVTALAARSGATAFMVLLAAFQIVLARLSGQDDIVVGTMVANRRHTSLHGLIGFLANSIVLRGRPRGGASFQEFLRETRRACLDAFDHQDIPLDTLVQRLRPVRHLGRNPIYQVNFSLHNTPEAVALAPGLTLVPLPVDDASARFDLDLNIWETDAGLECHLVYATDLFDAGSVERFARSFAVLLGAALDDPATALRALPLLDGEQTHRLADHAGRGAHPVDPTARHIAQDREATSRRRVLTPTGQRIAEIWGELLDRTGIAAEDDFFALGGHSLLTLKLVFRLKAALGVDVPTRAPFEFPVLADLADLVERLPAQPSRPCPADVDTECRG